MLSRAADGEPINSRHLHGLAYLEATFNSVPIPRKCSTSSTTTAGRKTAASKSR